MSFPRLVQGMTTNNNFNIFTTTSRGKLEPGDRWLDHGATALLIAGIDHPTIDVWDDDR